MTDRDPLTLVLDIGKSHAKLLMIDAAGNVAERHTRANRSVASPLGYPALDIAGLEAWITHTLAGLAATRCCTRAIASTHGAAFVGLGEAGLAWAPIDYEFDGYESDDCADTATAYQRERDDFAATLAPDLPAGLNAARQIHWLQHTHPQAWAHTRTLLPYPQYWAWWLSGVAASEVSSLGCHTQMWRPVAGEFSDIARRDGWAERFAPLRPAWQVLGRVRPQRARELGLPEGCDVHVGVHDSNACLARYLRRGDAASDGGMTLVSTGTWIIVMAPGAATRALDPARDMLGNVSVRGEVVPTARFMGGRELEALCAGAAPTLASVPALEELIHRDVMALPSFAAQGGPYAGHVGSVQTGGQGVDVATLPAPLRASLGALYCAQLTALLLERLGAAVPVMLEGPFAENPAYVGALAALLPPGALHISTDSLEGTARGAWMLTRWWAPVPTPTERDPMPAALAVEPASDLVASLRRYHEHWLQRLSRFD